MTNPCGEFRKDMQKRIAPGGPQSAILPACSMTTIQTQSVPTTPMRPRSLYTTHSYHAQTEDTNFQVCIFISRYSEFSKYFETPPADQWTGMTGTTTYSSSPAIWRQPRNLKTIAAPYYANEEPCVYTENWREHETDAGSGGAITTPHGTISLRLRNRIRVDMTVDRAVRVINFKDISLSVFYSGSRHGSTCLQEATTVLGASQYWITDEGVENWIINNVRISQTPDGLVRIGRNSNKYQLRTSPSNGTASLTTPFLHCTASLGQTSHLFVRRGERRMHYDGTSFIVRNAGHSAGFDDNDQLKVY
ncbi:uncharacterized protein LOC118440793 isoform X3 [Vespa mandarinia]|uniref:uncharacterized protein LOC118440793 isoform X3 n=1 Tax=Vespa mandarinia TaxID=7446 RepID=UPI001608E595|nr:uncharacterized protein LOC118440793 isoform X3 [Vespa mandarinia]XP_047355358.1 uncharacterized protein LOC124951266 isoform X3 [Vespa velutina]